jgi:hypothetical protein
VSVADDIFSSLSAQGVSQTASVEVYKHFADFVRRLIAARRLYPQNTRYSRGFPDANPGLAMRCNALAAGAIGRPS